MTIQNYLLNEKRKYLRFFEKRAHKAAHPQMRELAYPLRDEFRKLLPVVFDNCGD